MLESRELMRLVRDVDVTLDPTRGRVGEYDRETVVRLFREYEFRTLHRSAAAAGRRATRGRGRGDARAPRGGLPRRPGGRPRAGGCAPGRGPPRPRRAPALDGLRRRLVPAGAPAPPADRPGIAATPPAVEARAQALAAVAGDLPGALAAAIVDPGRIELADAEACRHARGARCATRRRSASPLIADDPRPLAGTPLALAVAGEDGRVVAADGPDASVALRHLLEALGCWTRRPRRQAAAHRPVRRGRGRDTASGRVRHADRRLPRERRAPRAEDRGRLVAERLDLVLPPAAAGLPPTATAGLEALSSPRLVRPSLEQALRDEGVDRLFTEVELPLIPILARMEAAGVALDQAALSALEREFGEPRSPRYEEEIYAAVGHEFTIGSPKQLGDILFVEPGLPKGRRTKTGYSTDAWSSRSCAGSTRSSSPCRVADLHEAALDLRRGAADADRPRRPAPHAVPPGRRRHGPPLLVRPQPPEHPDPDAPRRRIRHAFVAGSPDLTLVAADYSQIELGSLPTWRATSTSRTRSRARPTSTARPRHGSCARSLRT